MSREVIVTQAQKILFGLKEEKVLSYCTQQLEKVLKIELVSTSDSSVLVQEAKNKTFFAIIVDFEMLKRSGLDLLQGIWSGNNSKTKTVVLAESPIEVQLQLKEYARFEVPQFVTVTKPFSAVIVKEALQKLGIEIL